MEVLSHTVTDHPDTGVIMMTAVGDSQTAVEAMKRGAYDYVTKPFDLDDLALRVARALERRKLLIASREYHVLLEQKVERQAGQMREYSREAVEALAHEEMMLKKLSGSDDNHEDDGIEELHLQMARALAQMAELHEPYARGHSERVTFLACEIAAQIGCPDDLTKDIRLAATAHDIGKIVIPDVVLFKPGRLTSAEYGDVKRHPTAATDIVGHIERFKRILPLIESHHEWFNGRGYPRKLRGASIPLGARIMAVADSYDAMTCPRPYRPRLSDADAAQALKKGAAAQWDPEVVSSLLTILARESMMLESTVVET
jgi:putative two-component system response regulator